MLEFEQKAGEAADLLFWDPLLELIDEGRVVPVVGCDLLTGSDGRNLYRELAARLATRLGQQNLTFPDGDELNEVAFRHLAKGGQLREIYPALKIVAGQVLKEYSIPEVLLQLARIGPLKLFVTTTFDPLLARALNQERAGGRAEAQSIAYAPNDPRDLPRDWKLDRGPGFVYQLLGALSAEPSYVVTQEDIVEFLYALQSETRRPPVLFDELKKRTLLILGDRFSSWVLRFFMRMTKGEPLSVLGKPDYLADNACADDNLTIFLRTFSQGTKVYTGGNAADFVNELYRRWSARAAENRGDEAPREESKHPGAIFLSYASEDREAVIKIKQSLEAEGMDVYFDKASLEEGDEYDKKLRRAIHQCSLFLPVISKNTLKKEKRYFRIEWNDAIEIERMTPFGEVFLIPIVIDDTKLNDENLPARFQDFHIKSTSAPGGDVSQEFVARVKQLYRRCQLEMSRGAK